jgi:hypothetical protein
VVGRIFKMPVAPGVVPGCGRAGITATSSAQTPWTGHDLALGLQRMLRIGDYEKLAERAELRAWGAKWE